MVPVGRGRRSAAPVVAGGAHARERPCGRAPAGGSPDPGGARSQLAFDLAEVIAAAARPVLVVIDDAHQADTSSLRLLTELAPALRAMPAVVLVTARDGDQAWRGRLDERDALLRSGLVITLPPFAEDDVAGLVAGVTGAPPAPNLVSVITERSGGNPFLATELARQLAGQDTSANAVRAAVPELRPGHHPREAGRTGRAYPFGHRVGCRPGRPLPPGCPGPADRRPRR